MTRPGGFAYAEVGDAVVIRHCNRPVTTLRGAAAQQFLAEVGSADPQALMARLTGNCCRGNERTATGTPVKHRPLSSWADDDAFVLRMPHECIIAWCVTPATVLHGVSA